MEAPTVDADRRCGRGARSSCRLDQHICEGGARPVDHRRGQRGKHTEQLGEQQVDGADDSSRIAPAGAPELVCERGHGHPGGRELGESGGAIRSVGNRRQTCRERRIEECRQPSQDEVWDSRSVAARWFIRRRRRWRSDLVGKRSEQVSAVTLELGACRRRGEHRE